MRGYDLTGQRFGKLLVIERRGSRHKQKLWLCKCACGNEHLVETYNLMRGQVKSCGCLRTYNKKKTGHKLPDRDAIIRRVSNVYRDSAKRRNMEFDLLHDSIEKLIFSNCFYCGTEPNNSQFYNYRDERIRYGGIDRVNNSLGYIENNVVPCCKTCNSRKHDIPMYIVTKIMEFENAKRN
jgi:hypothetical protein